MTKMTETQMSAVLARAAAFDNRRPDPIVLAAWLEAIGDLDFDDAMQAVVDHYATSTEWLKPAHVRAGVKRIRAERLANADLSVPAVDPDARDYSRQFREHLRAIADGRSVGVALTPGARRPAEPTDEYAAARAEHAAPWPRESASETRPAARGWCGRCHDETRTRTTVTPDGELARVPCATCGPTSTNRTHGDAA